MKWKTRMRLEFSAFYFKLKILHSAMWSIMQNISLSPKCTLLKRIPALLIVTQLCMFAVFFCCLQQHLNHKSPYWCIFTQYKVLPASLMSTSISSDWQGWCYWYNLLLYSLLRSFKPVLQFLLWNKKETCW